MIQIIVETLWNTGEPSARQIRVHPLPGQLQHEYRIWCSVAQRERYPVGSLFKVDVSWVIPKSREPYLRIDPSQEWQVVSKAEATAFVAKFKGRKVSAT
jgi:hypothetical protein